MIRAIAAKTGRPPTILLESEEPYIPWELAHVDPPLIAGVPEPGVIPPPPLPPFLAAQACVGRWVKALEPSDGPAQPLPAPLDKSVGAVSVVWGDYSKVEGYQNLPHARAEARMLAKAYGATRINPTGDTMSALLNNETSPTPDLIHFAVHGHWSRTGTDKDGIILTDGTVLIALEVHGATLSSAPFVFLNACQVGAGHSVLGHYSGIAAEFVYAGASCVVAPIWAIDDEVASSVAETSGAIFQIGAFVLEAGLLGGVGLGNDDGVPVLRTPGPRGCRPADGKLDGGHTWTSPSWTIRGRRRWARSSSARPACAAPSRSRPRQEGSAFVGRASPTVSWTRPSRSWACATTGRS